MRKSDDNRAGISRRTLLRVGAAGAAGLALGSQRRRAVAESPSGYVPRPDPTQRVLRIAATAQNPDGALEVTGVTADGTIPGPEIRAREGDLLRVRVENHLAAAPTTIHWHGLLVPAGMDGVPDISNAPIAPQRVYVYEYPLRQSGTYWYHSHWGFQEQVVLYGPLVIEEADAPTAAHDPVVMFGDWLHRDPAQVYASLRGASAMRGMKPKTGMKPMPGMQATSKADATPMAGTKA